MRQSGLTAIYDSKTRVLIVGTFPSRKSLALGQYYANPQNNF
jgi:G:T/U-mismatch repair DNA glycosylase